VENSEEWGEFENLIIYIGLRIFVSLLINAFFLLLNLVHWIAHCISILKEQKGSLSFTLTIKNLKPGFVKFILGGEYRDWQLQV